MVGRPGRATLLGSVARDLTAAATASVVIVTPAARLPDFGAAAAVELQAAPGHEDIIHARVEVPALRQSA